MSNPTEELKPCPACAAKAAHQEEVAYSVDSSYEYIGCTECSMRVIIWRGLALAITEWNTRADDWQPIEDAPKDGTEFLAWNGHCRKVTHWNEARGKFIGFECLVAPTHFRHLPQPPKEEG